MKVSYFSYKTIDSYVRHINVQQLSQGTTNGLTDHMKVSYLSCETIHSSAGHVKVQQLSYGIADDSASPMEVPYLSCLTNETLRRPKTHDSKDQVNFFFGSTIEC